MEFLWKKDYIECNDNRIVVVKFCMNGVFDFYNRECMKGKLLYIILCLCYVLKV